MSDETQASPQPGPGGQVPRSAGSRPDAASAETQVSPVNTSPAGPAAPTAFQLDSAQAARLFADAMRPTEVGPYRILDVLGEGGMGTVYLADQTAPVRRRVALKLIKLGLNTREVLARFEVERQALALMNHPNVARVLDAGATPDGRPYFVMEYVQGVPLNKHCNDQRLSVPERMELFAQVCQAVQHAHQKGIIHRDLKSSNILVEYLDGRPTPKVIDFGVAKATSQQLTEQTLFTQQGVLIGTPEYMSPEQADLTSQDIDTRTDIYALGVVLYQLLTDTLPFDARTLRSAGLAAMQQMIRDVEPAKPSTRLAALGSAVATGQSSAPEIAPVELRIPSPESRVPHPDAAEVATRRRTDTKSLLRQVRGDLDWIVMKCLEKDRARRYETANALALEIQRYLKHEPVLAGPPSAAYRVRKFVRRHRGGVVAAGLLSASLIFGLTGMTSLYLRAEEQRRRAVLAEQEQSRARQDAELERQRADREAAAAKQQAAVAESVNQFMTDMLGKVDPDQQPGNPNITVREVMDTAATELSAGTTRYEPAVEAAVRAAIGRTYMALGLYEAAEPLLRAALEQLRTLSGDQSADVATGLNNLAAVLYYKGDAVAAEPLYREALALSRTLQGDEHPSVATGLNNLAELLRAKGDYAAAEPLFREALALRRKLLGAAHPDVASSLNNLALLLKDKRDYAAAEPLYREALDLRRRLLGNEHPHLAQSLNNLAALLQAMRNYAAAEPLYREALDVRRRRLGDAHPAVAASLTNLALLLREKGDAAGAEPLFREALASYRKLYGDAHPAVAASLTNLALSLKDQGDATGAEPLFRAALASYRTLHGDMHPDVAQSLNNLAALLQDQGDYAATEPLYREALALRRKLYRDAHPEVAQSLNNLARLLCDQGDYAGAEPLYREALQTYRHLLPPGDWRIGNTGANLGRCLTSLKRFADAEPLLHEADGILRTARGVPPQRLGRNLQALIDLYDAWHGTEPDAGHDRQAAEWRAKLAEWQASTQPAASAP